MNIEDVVSSRAATLLANWLFEMIAGQMMQVNKHLWLL